MSVKKRPTLIFAGVVITITLALLLPAVPVCRDCAFVDRATGSRRGYREWFFGLRTGEWYRQTALEDFLGKDRPAGIQQDWVSYAGTGRNVFGGSLVHGHGRPGPILGLSPELIDEYCRTASEVEKRRLLEVFASGDAARIQELVQRIGDARVAER
jgi:hypothetical protein